uniref:Uncharacterized protein n=1 Tax=Schlesneria paludicola TaxID=360056 RepID=A0A7C4LN45_9PLAN
MSGQVLHAAAILLMGTIGLAAEGKLVEVKQLPEGVAEKVAAALHPAGYQVRLGEAAACTIWLAKDLPAKADFQPTLNVKYPFSQGQLVGLLLVEQKTEFTDFRGQAVPAGVYTLRYAQQPVDGNHVGTSELYDFLLALPAKDDADPAPLTAYESLVKKSAATVGTNHPAIFALLPADSGAQPPVLEHDAGRELWQVTLAGKSGGKTIRLKLVVIGQSEG